MSDITIKYKSRDLFINPGWIHEIMFLLVREFEREPAVIQEYKLHEIIDDYKYYYSIAGDAFEDQTSFDEIFMDKPNLHNLFLRTLQSIKQKLSGDRNFLTLNDLEGKVDIGIIRLVEIQIEMLIDKIIEIEFLLEK